MAATTPRIEVNNSSTSNPQYIMLSLLSKTRTSCAESCPRRDDRHCPVTNELARSSLLDLSAEISLASVAASMLTVSGAILLVFTGFSFMYVVQQPRQWRGRTAAALCVAGGCFGIAAIVGNYGWIASNPVLSAIVVIVFAASGAAGYGVQHAWKRGRTRAPHPRREHPKSGRVARRVSRNGPRSAGVLLRIAQDDYLVQQVGDIVPRLPRHTYTA